MSEAAEPAPRPGSMESLGLILRHPGFRPVIGMLGVAMAITIGISVFFWSQTPAMVPLFSDLMPSDEMAIIERLKSRNIPYARTGSGGGVLVPAAEVHELRLELSAEGIPRGAGVGFELLQDTGTLGGSAMMENARYQHALETELGRTIAALQPVQTARVHLAMQRRSAFVRSRQKATAAVMLTLHSGRSLDAGQVASIVHLVSSSVPDLPADQVSIVDQRGQLLSRHNRSQAGLDAEQLAYRMRVENHFAERIRQLILPLVGAGRISAQVTVDMDFSRTEETREQYNPESRTLRSEQSSEESRGGAAVGGVPGALSNRSPDAKAPTADAAAVQNSSRQQTRNYEIDRTIAQSWTGPGRLRRVSAAVVVDHVPVPGDSAADLVPLPAERMQQIEALVREAIGFDAQRGDSVNVQNLRFAPLENLAPDPLPLWQQPELRSVARQLIGLALLLFIAFRLLRPAVRAVLHPANIPALTTDKRSATLAVEDSTPAGAVTAAVSAAGAQLQSEVSQPQPPPSAAQPINELEQKLLAAREAASSDPKRVAQLVRGWISDD